MGNAADAVAMVIRIGVHFGLCGLAIGGMGKRYRSRLVSKRVGGHFSVVTAHQVVFNGLYDSSLDVVVIDGINFLTAAEYIHNGSRQTALGIVRSIIGILVAYIIGQCGTECYIIIVEVLQIHRFRLHSFLTPLCQTVELVVHIEGPFTCSSLIPVLREYRLIIFIVFIVNAVCTRQPFPFAEIAVIITIAESELFQTRFILILRLQYKAQVSLGIIYKIGVELFGTMAKRIFVTIKKNSLTFFCQGVLYKNLIAFKS